MVVGMVGVDTHEQAQGHVADFRVVGDAFEVGVCKLAQHGGRQHTICAEDLADLLGAELVTVQLV